MTYKVSRQTDFLIFAAFLSVFFMFITSVKVAYIAAFFAPYVAMCCIRNNNTRSPIYYIAVLAFCAGSYFISGYMTAYFILSVVVPVIILMLSLSLRSKYPWFGIMFCCMPLLIILAVAITLPSGKDFIYSNILRFIEEWHTFIENVSAVNGATGSSFYERAELIYTMRAEVSEYLTLMLPIMLYSFSTTIMYFTERIFYKLDAVDILKVPDSLLIVIIISIVSYLFSCKVIALNAVLFAALFYLFRGVDIIRYHLVRLRCPSVVRGLFYVLVFVEQFFTIAVAIFGLMSVFINLTRDKSGEQNKK